MRQYSWRWAKTNLSRAREVIYDYVSPIVLGIFGAFAVADGLYRFRENIESSIAEIGAGTGILSFGAKMTKNKIDYGRNIKKMSKKYGISQDDVEKAIELYITRPNHENLPRNLAKLNASHHLMDDRKALIETFAYMGAGIAKAKNILPENLSMPIDDIVRKAPETFLVALNADRAEAGKLPVYLTKQPTLNGFSRPPD